MTLDGVSGEAKKKQRFKARGSRAKLLRQLSQKGGRIVPRSKQRKQGKVSLTSLRVLYLTLKTTDSSTTWYGLKQGGPQALSDLVVGTQSSSVDTWTWLLSPVSAFPSRQIPRVSKYFSHVMKLRGGYF